MVLVWAAGMVSSITEPWGKSSLALVSTMRTLASYGSRFSRLRGTSPELDVRVTTCSGATTISSVTAVIDRSAEPIMASRPSASRLRAPEDSRVRAIASVTSSAVGTREQEATEGDSGAAKVCRVTTEVGGGVGLVCPHEGSGAAAGGVGGRGDFEEVAQGHGTDHGLAGGDAGDAVGAGGVGEPVEEGGQRSGRCALGHADRDAVGGRAGGVLEVGELGEGPVPGQHGVVGLGEAGGGDVVGDDGPQVRATVDGQLELCVKVLVVVALDSGESWPDGTATASIPRVRRWSRRGRAHGAVEHGESLVGRDRSSSGEGGVAGAVLVVELGGIPLSIHDPLSTGT